MQCAGGVACPQEGAFGYYGYATKLIMMVKV